MRIRLCSQGASSIFEKWRCRSEGELVHSGQVLALLSRAILAAAGRAVCGKLREDVCELALADASDSLGLFGKNGLLVVGVPGSARILHIETLLSELLELEYSLLGWHGCLEFLVVGEFVRLEVISHEKRCSVDNLDGATGLANRFNC